MLTALAALSVWPVWLIDVPGANESGFGVRHQRQRTTGYHCEPWLRRVRVAMTDRGEPTSPALPPLSTDSGRLQRTRDVMADASARLRAVCANLSDDDSAALTRQIAEVTVK